MGRWLSPAAAEYVVAAGNDGHVYSLRRRDG